MEQDKRPTITMKMARAKLKLSQAEVAKKLNISRKTYQEYEKGNLVFRVDKAAKFASICDVPFGKIIFYDKNYTSSVHT